MQTHFADTILNISVTGPLVRLEFGTVAPAAGQDGKQEVRTTPTQQVVMPIEGFARAFGMQESVIRKLVADGVLKENRGTQANAAAAALAAAGVGATTKVG